MWTWHFVVFCGHVVRVHPSMGVVRLVMGLGNLHISPS